MPNQLEAKILEMTERYPTMSYLRMSSQLNLVGVGVSPAAVRAVWQRHGLTLPLPEASLARAENGSQRRRPDGNTDEGLAPLERQAHRSRGHIESLRPGFLMGQDTYFVGTIKGVGRIEAKVWLIGGFIGTSTSSRTLTQPRVRRSPQRARE